MKAEKIKVLIVNNPLSYGGSDIVSIRLQQNLDKEKFECTYCLFHGESSGELESEVAKSGVRIIHMPEVDNIRKECYGYFDSLFKKEKFDVVHCHLPFVSAFIFKAAKKNGINKRVVHSHFSQPVYNTDSKIRMILQDVYHVVMRRMINRYSTDIIGCTREAGIYVAGKRGFKKKGIVLNNGIDTSVYEYNEETRNRKRKELGVDSQIVLGHVGRIYYIKNQLFLIDVFFEFQKTHPNSVLLIVGEGPDREQCEKKVANFGIENKVKFLGFRDDVPELLMAMDCMVFPSLHEGLPLTLIEAQATKLPCVVSNSVNEIVKVNNNVNLLALDEPVGLWCNNIEELVANERAVVDNKKLVDNYDIMAVSKKLEKIYLD